MAKFPIKQEGDNLGASHVNWLTEGVEKSQSYLNRGGLVNGAAIPPFQLAQFDVVEEGCDGDADLYRIVSRYWDVEDEEWKSGDATEDRGYALDARDTDQEFEVDDKVQAYYDPQRGAFVPLMKGNREFAVVLDAALPVATQAKTGGSSCLARKCIWDADLNDYIETQEQVTVWNHSEVTAYAINTFGFAREIDHHFVFFGDCEAMTTPNRTALVP